MCVCEKMCICKKICIREKKGGREDGMHSKREPTHRRVVGKIIEIPKENGGNRGSLGGGHSAKAMNLSLG